MTNKNPLHISHEVIDSDQKAHSLGDAYSSQNRYEYLADAMLIGYATIEPYKAVYFEGLKDNMSGVWVVISVKHIFNKVLPYSLHVRVGTNDELLSMPKPKNATHINFAKDTHLLEIVNDSASLFSKNKEKKGKHYYEKINVHHIPIEPTHAKPRGYDPVKHFLSQSAIDGIGNESLYTTHGPNHYMEPEAVWRKKH
jgi:hypothetical protein